MGRGGEAPRTAWRRDAPRPRRSAGETASLRDVRSRREAGSVRRTRREVTPSLEGKQLAEHDCGARRDDAGHRGQEELSEHSDGDPTTTTGGTRSAARATTHEAATERSRNVRRDATSRSG
jgi:hypothetical protein